MIILFISCPLVFNHHDYLLARKHIFFIHQSQRSRDRTFLETNKQKKNNKCRFSVSLHERAKECLMWRAWRCPCSLLSEMQESWTSMLQAEREREGGGKHEYGHFNTRIKCVSRSKSLGWHPVVVWVTCSHIRSLPTCPEATRTPSKAPFTIRTWY